MEGFTHASGGRVGAGGAGSAPAQRRRPARPAGPRQHPAASLVPCPLDSLPPRPTHPPQAIIEGLDIARDMGAVYSLMGACPQHDLLWDGLTGGWAGAGGRVNR